MKECPQRRRRLRIDAQVFAGPAEPRRRRHAAAKPLDRASAAELVAGPPGGRGRLGRGEAVDPERRAENERVKRRKPRAHIRSLQSGGAGQAMLPRPRLLRARGPDAPPVSLRSRSRPRLTPPSWTRTISLTGGGFRTKPRAVAPRCRGGRDPVAWCRPAAAVRLSGGPRTAQPTRLPSETRWWWTHGLPPQSGTVTAETPLSAIAAIDGAARHDFRAGWRGRRAGRRARRCPSQGLRGLQVIAAVGRAAAGLAVGHADGRPRSTPGSTSRPTTASASPGRSPRPPF